jgi:hypothetical protein
MQDIAIFQLIVMILKPHSIPPTILTVVKELRSKMFGQHSGYFKAVFLKQTRIIIEVFINILCI